MEINPTVVRRRAAGIGSVQTRKFFARLLVANWKEGKVHELEVDELEVDSFYICLKIPRNMELL